MKEERRSSSEAPKEFQKEDLLFRSTRSVHEEHFESSSHGYVHSAISPKLQHFTSDSFMKGGKEGVSLIDALPRARSPFDEESSSQEESMKVSPSIEGQDPRYLVEDEMIPVGGEEEEKGGDGNAVTSKAPPALHEEEDGALAPREETVALLQEFPQDLKHEEHVLSLICDEVLEIGEVEEEEEHPNEESMNPSLL